jgi:hypothetical protein
MSATDDLIKQILASSNTSKWTGQGYGSAEKNAADMAKILSSIGITDIHQFGKIPQYETRSQYKGQDVQVDDEGNPYIMVPGAGLDDYGNPMPARQNIDPKDVKQEKVKVGETFGNIKTGQEVPNTYSERQTGDFFGGTFAGKGNTGYGVRFDASGNPIFYTQGASSNDVANIMQDLGPVGNIAAAALGGPWAVAALAAASGKPIKDIAKSAALSYLGGQAGDLVSGTSGITDVLGKTGTDVLSGAAKQYVASGGKADPIQALIAGGLNAGTGSIADQLGLKDLTPAQQKMLSTALGGAISGQSLDKILMNAAMTGAMTKDNTASNLGPGTAEEFSKGLIPGYFLPGGAGYTDKQVTNPLGPTEEFDPSTVDWEALAKEGMSPEDLAKREALMKMGGQDMQINPNYWKEYNDNLIDIVNNKGGYTSQWQTVGGDRIMVQDDGTAIATNENGDSYSLDADQVTKMIDQGLLNTDASGYTAATGGTKTGATRTTTPIKTTTPTTSGTTSAGGQQQTVQLPSQDPFAHIKLMKELFGPNVDLTPTDSSDNTSGSEAE